MTATPTSPTLRIGTDPAELDVTMIHRFLSTETYWAAGIGIDVVAKALAHSLCFGAYLDDVQVAFARVITDRATFANLVDVFVLPAYRGRGYGRDLMDALMAHPDLQGLRRFTLATADAHDLYAGYGFTAPSRPQTLMERYVPDIYRGSAS